MVEPTLTVAALSTLAVAATYGYVGARLLRKADRSPSGRAIGFFSAWWIMTAANQVMGASLYLAASFGYTNFALQLTYVVLQRLLLAGSLVGLMYYLLYLHTGRSFLKSAVVFYAIYYALTLYTVMSGSPHGVDVYRWRTDLAMETPLPASWQLVNLMIVLPPIVGALMLVRAYRRVEGPTRRFRIGMIAGGFTLWWLVAIVAGQRALLDVDLLQGINRLIGITVALGILLAYEPLGWMKRRYHLEAFSTRQA